MNSMLTTCTISWRSCTDCPMSLAASINHLWGRDSSSWMVPMGISTSRIGRAVEVSASTWNEMQMGSGSPSDQRTSRACSYVLLIISWVAQISAGHLLWCCGREGNKVVAMSKYWLGGSWYKQATLNQYPKGHPTLRSEQVNKEWGR